MKLQRVLLALTLLNLILLGFLVTHVQPALATNESTILKARGLEIVDEQGRVRASLKVYPADPTFRGEDGRRGYPETVMLRLVTSDGRPIVKLAGKEDGAAIVLGGERNPAYAWLGTEGVEPKLQLVDRNGRPLVLTPDAKPTR